MKKEKEWKREREQYMSLTQRKRVLGNLELKSQVDTDEETIETKKQIQKEIRKLETEIHKDWRKRKETKG